MESESQILVDEPVWNNDFEFKMNDFSDMFKVYEDELGLQDKEKKDDEIKNIDIAKIEKKINGATSLAKTRAKPKEMVLDYLEMDINSGTDPKNATLVMADMLRDKKLLTKFKGTSETGLSLDEYAEIMSGVVMETEQLIEDEKLPETITENGVDRQTSIDDFINMTFDDTEILLSNLPGRISDLTKEEIAELITTKVKETEQELELEQESPEVEKVEEQENEQHGFVQNEVMDKWKQIEAEGENPFEEMRKVPEERETTVEESKKQEELAQKLAEQQRQEKQVEESKQEKGLIRKEERSLMQKASAGIRNFLKAAKEKVGDFFESMKEKFGGKSDDKFGSEVFAMDATKKNEQKKKDEDQWQTIDGNESLKAAQEEAKRRAEKEQEQEPVTVGERDEK